MEATDPLLLGIDVGTSNIKAALVSPDGRVLTQTQIAYPTFYPQPGWVEQQPEDWWSGTVTAVREVVAAVAPERIVGIGVSGQGCAVTLVDAAGQVIHPALIWMDSRSEAECEILRQTCAHAILRVNGKQPAPYNADPKLMWFARHEPDVLREARYSLTTTAYINFRLTGEYVINKSDASILFAFDLQREDWSPELITAFGIPAHLYPPVTDCGAIISGLTNEAASELGLKPGTPIVAGGEDTSSAGLALGVGVPGQAFLSLGTAGTVYVVADRVVVHPNLLTFLHVLPGKALIGGSMIAAGAALDWCRKLVSGDLSFDQLTQLAHASDVGAGGVIFLPYLSGELQPVNDGNARGVFFGLSFNTEAPQLVRAVMEGVAYAIAHNLLIIGQMGIRIENIRAVGAPAQNPFWCQIIADVTGCGVEVIPGAVGAPLGNALLCAASLRLIDDLVPVAESCQGERHTFEPQPAAHEQYVRLFEVYRALYPALKTPFTQLQNASRKI